MNILNDIPELVREEVISQDTADRIRTYYQNKRTSPQNRLFIVFGILGAILVGLGIILIIAHNWDELNRAAQTLFAFLPLLVGQLLCAFALFKKAESEAWRESAAAFLFFAIGASISLVSQIYHIPGDLSSFLLTWMALCLPLVYVLRSSVASLLYMAGITYYAAQNGYWSHPSGEPYIYWLLLLLILPHYYQLYRERPQSNFMIFHNWFIPLSILIVLGTAARSHEAWLFPAYISLFGLFYIIGNLPFFKGQRARNGGYGIIGSFGTISLLLAVSFTWFWDSLRDQEWSMGETIVAPEFIAAAIITLAAGGLLYWQRKNVSGIEMKPLEPVFILFFLVFILGTSYPISVVLTNLLILTIGVATIRNGARQDHLGILNFGLLIIAALVICRFFDTELSFVVRGILFVLVGLGFFIMNYWTLQKRKAHEQ